VAISLSLCVYDWLSRHADAIAAGPGSRLFFVEPFIEQVNIAQLLETLNIGKHTFMLKNHPRIILSKFQQSREVIAPSLLISNRKMGIYIPVVILSRQAMIRQNLILSGKMFQVTSHGSPKH